VWGKKKEPFDWSKNRYEGQKKQGGRGVKLRRNRKKKKKTYTDRQKKKTAFHRKGKGRMSCGINGSVGGVKKRAEKPIGKSVGRLNKFLSDQEKRREKLQSLQ